jgi:hypothetical protein
MGARIRAFFVLGAVCAVTIGLLAPAFSRPASMVASGVASECPHAMAKSAVAASPDGPASSHAPRHSSAPGCPDCCLAAHLGMAVLPLRSASFARPERRVASRIRYADCAAIAVKPVAAEAANGARAPPAA